MSVKNNRGSHYLRATLWTRNKDNPTAPHVCRLGVEGPVSEEVHDLVLLVVCRSNNPTEDKLIGEFVQKIRATRTAREATEDLEYEEDPDGP